MAPCQCSKCCFLNSLVPKGITQISQRSRRRMNWMTWARTASAVVVSTYYCWPPREQVPHLSGSSSTSMGTTCFTCLNLCGMLSACWPQRQTTAQCCRESTGMYSRGSSCATSLPWRSSSLQHHRTTSPQLFSAENLVYRSVKTPSAVLWLKMFLKGIATSHKVI